MLVTAVKKPGLEAVKLKVSEATEISPKGTPLSVETKKGPPDDSPAFPDSGGWPVVTSFPSLENVVSLEQDFPLGLFPFSIALN